MSGALFWAHSALPCAQCTIMPSKSATALVEWAAAAAAASMACGELGPNTLLMSPVVFSKSIFAIEKAPTSQPARVNGTQGAGAFSALIEHLRQSVSQDIGPISEGARERRHTVLAEEPKAVADRKPNVSP